MNCIFYRAVVFLIFLALLTGSSMSFAQQVSGQAVNGANSQPVADQAAPAQNSPSADLAAATSQAVAGPFDPISTRIMTDPLYLPLKGQFYGSSEYNFTRRSESQDNSAGNEFTSAKTDENTLSQTIEYGLIDDLALRFSDSYSFYRDYHSGADYKLIGFSEPEFGATYRAIDQVQYPVDVDLTANYNPDAIGSKAASANKTGTIASGRQELTLEGAVGREMKDLTVQVFADADYLGKEKYEELSNDTDALYKSQWEYTFGVNTQTRLTDRFSINLGTAYTVANNTEHTTSTGLSGIYVSPNYWDFNTSLNYQIIPDRLTGSFVYDFNDYSNTKFLYPTQSNDVEYEKHTENIFGLKFSYLFN